MAIEGPLAGVALTARLDGLSAFFAIVIAAVGAVTTVYAIGHTRDHRSFPGSGALYLTAPRWRMRSATRTATPFLSSS